MSTTLESRIHSLRTFNTPDCLVYVKREDELPYGNKGRKYLSLLPWILEKKPEEVVLVGGPYSNHIVAMSQILLQHGIKPIPFFFGRKQTILKGNQFLISLLIPPSSWIWGSREDAEALSKVSSSRVIIPMGGSMEPAIPGTITLVQDLLKNQQKLGCSFDHIFIPGGTGFTAALLILGLAIEKISAHTHVVLAAGSFEEFKYQLEKLWKPWVEKWLGRSIDRDLSFSLYTPSTSKAYGSINGTLQSWIKTIAREEGILLDPIYNAKTFYEGKKIIQEKKLNGNILFIHTGGTQGLAGFQTHIE